MANADFRADCGSQEERRLESASNAPSESLWKRALRIAFIMVFFLVWVDGVASFYFFGIAFRGGAPAPTLERSERLEDHGATVYVTPSEKRLVDRLETIMMVGIPAVIGCGALIHFVLGVKLLPNVSTRREARLRKTP